METVSPSCWWNVQRWLPQFSQSRDWLGLSSDLNSWEMPSCLLSPSWVSAFNIGFYLQGRPTLTALFTEKQTRWV